MGQMLNVLVSRGLRDLLVRRSGPLGLVHSACALLCEGTRLPPSSCFNLPLTVAFIIKNKFVLASAAGKLPCSDSVGSSPLAGGHGERNRWMGPSASSSSSAAGARNVQRADI